MRMNWRFSAREFSVCSSYKTALIPINENPQIHCNALENERKKKEADSPEKESGGRVLSNKQLRQWARGEFGGGMEKKVTKSEL